MIARVVTSPRVVAGPHTRVELWSSGRPLTPEEVAALPATPSVVPRRRRRRVRIHLTRRTR